MRKFGLIACVFLSCACAKNLEGQDPASCDDGEDNDLDGRMDCEDDGCKAATICVNAAREAELAAKKAETARERAKIVKPAVPEEGPTFAINGLTVNRAQNGADVNWSEAENYCKNLNMHGFDDWRLPDVNEAVKIVESGRLKGEASYVMWTSTHKGAKQAVIVGMSGAVNELGIQNRGQCRARCVRGSLVK